MRPLEDTPGGFFRRASLSRPEWRFVSWLGAAAIVAFIAVLIVLAFMRSTGLTRVMACENDARSGAGEPVWRMNVDRRGKIVSKKNRCPRPGGRSAVAGYLPPSLDTAIPLNMNQGPVCLQNWSRLKLADDVAVVAIRQMLEGIQIDVFRDEADGAVAH